MYTALTGHCCPDIGIHGCFRIKEAEKNMNHVRNLMKRAIQFVSDSCFCLRRVSVHNSRDGGVMERGWEGETEEET